MIASGARLEDERNNAGNQLIERGSFSKINWGRAIGAGVFSAASSLVFGQLFKAIPGVDRVFTEEGQAVLSAPFGTLAGYCVDFGFGTDANYDVYCGIKVKPGPTVPQTQ